MLDTHIAQLMTHTPNVYIAAAYLAIKLLSLLAYCRGELRDTAKVCKLILGTLGMSKYDQIDSTNLNKTSISICMPKVKFIIHFFLEILPFKEPCNFIG